MRHLEIVTQRHWPTGAAKFLALDLSNTLVCKTARAGAAGAAGLNGVGAQVVCQPLQITVTNKWVLCQVTGEESGRGRDGLKWRGKGKRGGQKKKEKKE